MCSQNGGPSEIGGALLACTRSGPSADSQHPRHVFGGLGASLCGQLLVAQSTPELLFSISMNVHMNLSAHGLRLEAQAEADLSLMVAAIQQAAIVGVVRHWRIAAAERAELEGLHFSIEFFDRVVAMVALREFLLPPRYGCEPRCEKCVGAVARHTRRGPRGGRQLDGRRARRCGLAVEGWRAPAGRIPGVVRQAAGR